MEGCSPSSSMVWRDWSLEGWSASELESCLSEAVEPSLALRGIPNARLAPEKRLLQWLRSGQEELAPAAFSPLGPIVQEEDLSDSAPAVDPEWLWSLGERLGYNVQIRPSIEDPREQDSDTEGSLKEAAFRIDAVFWRSDTVPLGLPESVVSVTETLGEWLAFTNSPLRGRALRHLVRSCVA